MPHTFFNEEYVDMLLVYGKCDMNGRAAEREYRRRFPNRRVPNHKIFARLVAHTKQHGTFPSKTVSERPHTIEENIRENILETVQNDPGVSIRRLASIHEVSKWYVWNTLKSEKYHPYHPQVVQQLEPGDEIARLQFSRWIRSHRRNVQRILFTDEAQFTRDGINNARNNHLWHQQNPFAVVQRQSQRRFSVNVWCAVYDNNLIGPHFFEERLTGEIYRDFLMNVLPNLLGNINQRGLIFQHDGAPPHFSILVRNHLNEVYPNRWIGRGGPRAWPPRSPDMTPLDYFLWGHLKTMVYGREMNTREQLIQRIIDACDEIRNNPNVIRKAVLNLMKRADKCVEVGGFHFEQYLKN